MASARSSTWACSADDRSSSLRKCLTCADSAWFLGIGGLVKNRGKGGHEGGDLTGSDHQWRREPYDVGLEGVDQEARPLRRGLDLRGAVGGQQDAQPQTAAAD